jgi:hypothetical protein
MLGFGRVGVLTFASSSALGCVYRKLKLGRSGDEVRPGWRMN